MRHIFRICPAGKAPWEDFNSRRSNPSGMKDYGFPHSVACRLTRRRRRRVPPMMTDDGAEGKVANTNVASDETSAANTGSSGRSISNKSVVLDRNGWLAMWAMMVHFDPRHVMRYLWYMGYLGDSVKNGSAVREMHLKWPANRLHVKKLSNSPKPALR